VGDRLGHSERKHLEVHGTIQFMPSREVLRVASR
jgi:hypothetical protein